MKIFLLSLVVFLSAGRSFAAAPDRVDGYIYYESTSLTGAGDARASSTIALVLNANGTFSGLFSTSLPPLFPVSAGNPSSAPVSDGTYTYRKIDDQSAELTLSISINGGSEKVRVLQFSADFSGTMPRSSLPIVTSGASFKFAPLSSPAPLTNCSNRSYVRAGGTAFTGFVVPNGGARVLIRAVGPTLTAFGVSGALRDPKLTLVRADTGAVAALNDDWSAASSAQAITRASALVGAFPLAQDSKDSALILTLATGAYIAQASSPDAADTGEVLIEVYLLP